MNILDFFTSRSKKIKLAHLKRLIAVTCADGVIQDSEREALSIIMLREGLTPADFERCLRKTDSVKMISPDSDSQKRVYLKDLVHLMMIDGNIDKNEMLVCKLAAVEFGYRPEVIDKLLIDTIEDIKKELGIK